MANILITQLNNPVVLQQLNQRLAAIASVVMIVACAYLLVEITWLFFPQDEGMEVVEKSRTVHTPESQTQQNNFKNLTLANVFGSSQTAVVVKQTKVPETRLNLSLKGVLAATPMKMASAIIAQGKNGKEDIYGIDDKMPGGVTVKEIYPEYVVLERNGSLETLKLEKINDVAGFQMAGSKDFDSGEPGLADDPDGSISPEAALTEIRSDILKNPTSFGDYALPVVVKENGKHAEGTICYTTSP
ncbi:MAG: type II secretion system protein N, partial [Gammaproteobacteria bacterium]|nr:type II secretion system protein N [Gammaproteobacteria bacterium]